MPFQLYPQLACGASNEGVVKDDIFREMIEKRAPDMTDDQRLARVQPLCQAWASEGLVLKSPPTGLNRNGGGRMGSSFDSQRLILLAREQDKEDAMIEEVYAANHSRDECLSNWEVLLGCAERAGVVGAREALQSGWGVSETISKINEYKAMGVSAVPVVVIDSCADVPVKAVLSSGAPESDFLKQVFTHLLATGRMPWSPDQQPLPSPQPRGNWSPTVHVYGVETEREKAEKTVGAVSRVLDLLGSTEGSSQTHANKKAAFGLECLDDSTSTESASCDVSRGCAGGLCALPRALGDMNGERRAPVKNVLAGSKVASASRPHQLTIDADFVTCTQ